MVFAITDLSQIAVSAMGADGTEVYGKQQKKVDIQTEPSDEVQETGKIRERVVRPEPVIFASEESEEPEHGSLFPDNFQSVLFIGDSRTAGLHEYGQMGNANVFANSGMTVFNLWERGYFLLE